MWPPHSPTAANPPPPPHAQSARPNVLDFHRPYPQYRHLASAEDQAFTKELPGWILEGKLEQITPAHILTASLPIRKELEHFKPRRVETSSFEQTDGDEKHPVSVLKLADRREVEFSLPLHEIDILINNHSTQAGVLDQGTQIVVVREDLANEVGAKINTLHDSHSVHGWRERQHLSHARMRRGLENVHW